MKGSSTTQQPGVYGTQGNPAPENTPGARVGAVSWTDTSGRFWLYSGLGWIGDSGDANLAALWRGDPGLGPRMSVQPSWPLYE